MNYRFLVGLLLPGLSLLMILLNSCQSETNDSSETEITGNNTGMEEITEKEQIARLHCSGCHLFPDPDLLDKNTWLTQTLPAMGPLLGIFEYDGEEYPMDVTANLPEDFYPDHALVSEEDWQLILDYYTEIAPEQLTAPSQPEIIRENLFFEALRPSYRSDTNPMVSAIRFDPGNQLIYLADANLNRILIYNRDLEIVNSFEVPAAISDISFLNDATVPGRRELLITYIANINPSDALDGSVSMGWYDPQIREGKFDEKIVENIARPVESIIEDLDQNEKMDLLINEFGHRKGSVFWLKGDDKGGFHSEKNILMGKPGCLDTEIVDWTNNGLSDILVLCSQVDQAIYLFENTGKGDYNRETLLKFPITAGSSSFELHDFNNNGHLDILYTSGDNADYSMVYKPYHGVYIYTNDGHNNFSKDWFYNINGAYNANARDFNGNGHLDIVVTSFFADYSRKPQEGFIFFENNGDLSFTPYHPGEASYGRWIAMDVADWTGNGADDIVLANFSLGPTKVHPQIENILTQSTHLLVLKNLSSSDQEH